jgi:hypothetical protein
MSLLLLLLLLLAILQLNTGRSMVALVQLS